MLQFKDIFVVYIVERKQYVHILSSPAYKQLMVHLLELNFNVAGRGGARL